MGLISKEVFLMLFQCLANDGGLPNHWLNNFPDKVVPLRLAKFV